MTLDELQRIVAETIRWHIQRVPDSLGMPRVCKSCGEAWPCSALVLANVVEAIAAADAPDRTLSRAIAGIASR